MKPQSPKSAFWRDPALFKLKLETRHNRHLHYAKQHSGSLTGTALHLLVGRSFGGLSAPFHLKRCTNRSAQAPIFLSAAQPSHRLKIRACAEMPHRLESKARRKTRGRMLYVWAGRAHPSAEWELRSLVVNDATQSFRGLDALDTRAVTRLGLWMDRQGQKYALNILPSSFALSATNASINACVARLLWPESSRVSVWTSFLTVSTNNL